MILYKYFDSINTGLLSLGNSSFRLTPRNELNDIFEMLPAVKPLTIHQLKGLLLDKGNAYRQFFNILSKEGLVISWEEYENRISDDALISHYWETINKNLQDNIIHEIKTHTDRFGVCCLSKCNTNILMWSHYAKSHTGMTISYDFSDDYWSDRLVEVEYSDKRSRIRPIEFVNGNEIDKVLNNISRKSVDWEYEEEVRLIGNIEGFDPDENGLYLTYYDKAIVKEISLGFNVSNDDFERVLAYLSKEENAKISLNMINMHPKDYKLEAIDVLTYFTGKALSEEGRFLFNDYLRLRE